MRLAHGFLAAGLFLGATRASAETWSATHPTYPNPDVRALGMGGAFVALADGPTALAWNPAGLVEQVFPALAADFTVRSPGGASVFFGNPIGNMSAVGLGWLHHTSIPQRADKPITGAPTGLDRMTAGLATRLGSKLSMGIAGTYFNPRYRVRPDSTAEGVGVGVDVGLLLALTNQIRLGLALYDVSDAKAWRSGGEIDVLSRRSTRWGVAYTPSDRLVLSYQHDQSDQVGMEWYVRPELAVRGGLGYSDRSWEYSLGAAVRVGTVRMDYAYRRPAKEDDDHRIALQVVFPRGQAAVEMSKVQVRALYASLGKAYSRQPVGSVVLVNSSSTPVVTRVELYLPRYMVVPTTEEVNLRPYSRQRVFLRAVLSTEQIETVGDQPIQGMISLVNPTTEEVWRRESVQTYLYRKGAVTWDDIRKASAFVTPANPEVRAFVREALRPYRAELQQMTQTQEILTTAMILFQAAGEVGITYQVDPNTPYAEVRRSVSPVDMVKRIGQSTLNVAVAPVQMVANPLRSAIAGPDSARGDTLGVVETTVAGVSNLVSGVGTLGEESLRFLLYPYQAVVNPEGRDIVVDDIQYPVELLQSRAGDCDDSTVLMCALLECAGISTAFVESPQHLFMMFDTRLPVEESPYVLPGPEHLFVAFEGTWWIPLETTMFRQGFFPAWRQAATTACEVSKGGTLSATRVSDGWELYEPIEFHALDRTEIALPDPDRLRVRVADGREQLRALWDESPVARELIAPLDRRAEDYNRRANAAFWLLYAGRLDDADAHLRVLEDAGYEPPRVLGLRAVYWFERGDMAQAEAFARQAWERAPWVVGLQDLLDQIRSARHAEDSAPR